jgi:rubrerythrin
VEGGAAAAAVVEAMRPLAGDPAALQEAAMGIEMAAMDLYLRMAAQADAGLADLFHRLAGDERRHMEILAGWP